MVQSLTEAEAIAVVEALPEFKALATEMIGEGKLLRKKIPVAHVAKAPQFESSSTGGSSYWGIVVADQSYFDADGGAQTGVPPDLDLRIEAFARTVSVRNDNAETYRDYASWATSRRARHRSAALAMSIPEWDAEAAVVRQSPAGRNNGAVLSLVFGPEPPVGCQPGTPDCRYGFTAISICSGCAGGRWVDFEIDLTNETLFVNDNDFPSPVPYGRWRHHYRAKLQGQHPAEYRALLASNQAFPELKPGNGPFGYGEPLSVISTKAPSSVLGAISQGGFQLLRVERYAGEFPVYVVRADETREPRTADLRAWGRALVSASGGRSCEVAAENRGLRLQFDGNALKGDSGGVYALINGEFHPWLARE